MLVVLLVLWSAGAAGAAINASEGAAAGALLLCWCNALVLVLFAGVAGAAG
jgi:hypothetical protein